MSQNLDMNIDNLSCIPTKTECIIVDKVYAHCRFRECFERVEADIEFGKFKDIRFKPGFIVDGSLSVDDIPNEKYFKRVQFTLRIPYEITRRNGSIKEGYLPDITKDVKIFIPPARDEFDFRIVVETSAELLTKPIQQCDKVIFAVGVFVIIKVVGRVQLLIPAFGFCPTPDECIDFDPAEELCEAFDKQEFPQFFPPQAEDIEWE